MGLPVEWLDRFQAAGMVPVGVPARVDPGHLRPASGTYSDRRRPTSRKDGPSEAEFTEQVIQYAQDRQWRTAHFRAARTEHGWRTAVSGDGRGFVDLVLVRDRVVWAELKTDKGRLSPEQRAWSDVLKAAGCEVYLWRPASWGEIRRVLGP